MTAVPTLTPEEYLARERAVEARHEFRDGRMVPVPASSFAHSLLADDLCRLLNNALRGTPFRALAKAMRVKVPAAGLYAYPDVLVVDGPPVLEDAHQDTLLNPRVLVEVLSDATAADDRGAKFRQYKQLPSLREYVLVDPGQVLIERHVRRPDGWLAVPELTDPAGTFALESVPVSLPVADVYRGVEPAAVPPRAA